MRLRLAVILLCVFAPVGVFVAAWTAPAADDPRTTPNRVAAPAVGQIASASCASASCHGGGEVGAKGSEYTTWAGESNDGVDPHSRAYRVLFSPASQRMAKAVSEVAAHKTDLCLRCHSVPGVTPNSAATEGVGCGGCHGPAEEWLAAHVQPEWGSISARDRHEKYGFAPTKNLVARTLICAGCHVGDATREVNHDLIAAGHPRLAFEPAAFHHRTNYRKHWVEQSPPAEFEVRAWVTGQAVALRAAVDLVRVRAERAALPNSASPWPEFSGQSCYACHHPSGSKPADRKRPLGRAGWEVWATTTVDAAARFTPEVFPGVTAPELEHWPKLREAMNAKVSPDPRTVATLAAAARAELDRWVADLQAAEEAGLPALSVDMPRRIARALAGQALTDDRSALADNDWDALAITYLGCAAMYHAGGGAKRVPDWSDAVNGLNRSLHFPGEYNSPKDLDRAAVRGHFADLFNATDEGGKR